MLKTKNKVLCILACLLFMMGAVFSVSMIGNAEDSTSAFNFDSVTDANKTYLADVTSLDVVNAFNEEQQRLKTEEGWDFSKVTIANQPASNPWPNAFAGSAIIAAHLTAADYSSGNAWGGGYILLVFNPHTKKVYTIKDGALSKYTGSSDSWTKNAQDYGYPLDNQFTSGDNTYQNFSYGYMEIDGAEATFINGLRMGVNGDTRALTIDDYAETAVYPIYNPPSGATFANYVSEYKKAFSGLAIDLPITNPIQFDWNNIWMQKIIGAELSDGNFWGLENCGILTYNTSLNKMFFVVDRFAETWTNTPTIYGLPKDNQFKVGDVTYQNYDMGFMKYAVDPESESGEYKVSFKTSAFVDSDGNETALFTKEDVGKKNDNVELSGMTEEQLKEAVLGKYSDSMGLPYTYVDLYTGTKVLYQGYRNDSGETNLIFVNALENVVLLDNIMYQKYIKPDGFSWSGFDLLGLPQSNSFTYNDKIYQNFYKGYMELSAEKGKAFVGANIAADGKLTMLDFSDQIFFNTAISKVPASYNITGTELTAKFIAKYKALLAAGFAAGVPGSEGIKTWTEYEQDADLEFADGRGMIVLALQSGSSTAKPWYDVSMYMVYNPADREIHLIKDNIMTGVASFRSQLGAPVGEAFTYSGLTIQNFAKGYVAVSAAGNTTYKDDKHFDKDKGKEVNLDGSEIIIPGEDDENKDEENPKKKGCGSKASASTAAVTLGLGALAFVLLKRGR